MNSKKTDFSALGSRSTYMIESILMTDERIVLGRHLEAFPETTPSVAPES